MDDFYNFVRIGSFVINPQQIAAIHRTREDVQFANVPQEFPVIIYTADGRSFGIPSPEAEKLWQWVSDRATEMTPTETATTPNDLPI